MENSINQEARKSTIYHFIEKMEEKMLEFTHKDTYYEKQ